MTPNSRINRMTEMEISVEARMIAKGMTPEQFWDWYLNPVSEERVNKVDQDGWTTYDPETVKF